MELNGTISAVVTGGASGLGEATARALAAMDVKVAIFDMSADAGEAIAADIGGIFCEVDVTDEASVDAGFDLARAAQGQERILINCAGIGPAMKTVSRGRAHDMAQYRKVIGINMIGTFQCLAKSAAGMVEADPLGADSERGVIINTASVAAYDGQIGQVAYASSKAGIVGMTLPVARDLAQDGVRCCTIAPGLFLTPLMMTLPEEVRDSLGKQVPFPSRLGDPSEFADMALHIAENIMLNGEVIRLDGAIRMAPR